ncbi:SUN domain-containing protein 3-like isoform X1 [Mauremys reevesii]|uniref:SUN domain-containing protein 3-like isoform X1 n=2 Tax=Mauremys reevesii TaxID=260615 RepID=UPI00193F53A3|nr:SUN domain-containing protein 3-like isoform X1 [Mauremys reevesii]
MSGFQTHRHLPSQTMPRSNSAESTLTTSSQGSSKTTEKRQADESEVFTRMSYLAVETNTNASSSSGSLPPQKSVLRTVFNIPCLLIMAFVFLPRAFIKACISRKNLITLQNGKKFFKILLLLVPVIYAGIYCVGSLSSRRLAEGLASQETTELHETELKSLWQSHTLLEEKVHEIEHIKEQMQHLRAEINGVMEGILHSVQEILEESDIPGENRDQVLEMINVAFKKVYEDHVQMPDWAQKSIGATIDTDRTSKSFELGRTEGCCFGSWFFSSANPPDTILQPDVHPGNCWAFQGSQGQVVIKLPEKIYPTAVTLQHISKAISPSGDVTSAPKDFAVCGLDEETGKETLLGTFMYDSGKETIQTFQLKSELSKFFVYIKFNVLSNWGNPEYTCVYRVRVHGKMTDKS